uniref:Glycosyltransferase 2-like domain-containing protein n=1 Tax=Ditylum brightwellii TaxID=49249 RepID=A0A7S4SFH3_9STRA
MILLLSLFLSVLILLYLFYPAIKVIGKSIDVGVDDLILTNNDNTKQQQPILSIIIPAYNEEERLPPMLLETYTYLTKNRKDITNLCHAATLSCCTSEKQTQNTSSFELIVVDDGSIDDTRIKTIDFVNQHVNVSNKDAGGAGDSFRLITLHQNSGKGAAVRAGMIRAKGALCLMADADGATDITDGLPAVLKEMANVVTTTTTTTTKGKS